MIQYGRFLTLLLATFIVSGLGHDWASRAVWGINILIVLGAVRLTRLTSKRPVIAVLLALAVSALVIGIATGFADNWRGVSYLAQFFMFAIITIAVIGSILQRGRVDGQTLLGLATAYFLIGLTFSWLILAVDVWDDTQFSLDPSNTADYSEFSFITMTTVGFGNQLPTANLGARIVVIEVLIAQLFLATFVARMVSMYGRHAEN